MTMLRSGVPRFKDNSLSRGAAVLVLCASAAVAAGCYWSRYGEVMSTHLELLEQYAAKLAALAQDHKTVPAKDWGEFVYPLERGRDFARIATKRYPERASLARFEAVLVAYADMVASPDVLARQDAEAVLKADEKRLAEAIAATRQALASEAQG
jgi:hypothetical protein